jgi:hypothetical protein
MWPQDGYASIALPQRRRHDFLPPGFAHSSRGKKVTPLPSSAALRPAGASPIACGLSIAIETAMGAGSSN